MRHLENVLWYSFGDRTPYRRPVFAPGQTGQFARKLALSLKAFGLNSEALAAEKVTATRIWHLPPRLLDPIDGSSLSPTLAALRSAKTGFLLDLLSKVEFGLSVGGWTPATEKLLKSFFGDRCFGPWAFSRPIRREESFEFFKAELAAMLAHRASFAYFGTDEMQLSFSDSDGTRLALVTRSPAAITHIRASTGQIVTEYATAYERAASWLQRSKPEVSEKLVDSIAMLRLYAPQSALNIFETAIQQVPTESKPYSPPASRFDEQVLDDLRLLWAADKPLAERYLDLWHACVPDLMEDTEWVAIFGHAGHYVPPETSQRTMSYKFQNFVGWYLNQLRMEKGRNGK